MLSLLLLCVIGLFCVIDNENKASAAANSA